MKPLWREGLFMMPQHLQLLDDYHEQLLDHRVDTLAAHGWGVSELEIDVDELTRGIFRIQRCTAVMPDGLLVRIGEDYPLKGVMALSSGNLAGGGQRAEVYLAVPGTDARGTPSYAGDGKAAGTRFIHRAQNLADVYGMAQEAEVDYLMPNVQILLGHENRQNYISFKLVELELDDAGSLMVSQGYIPPCLKIRACPPLVDRLSRMVAAIGAKQRHLSERYGGRVGSMVEFGAADMATFWYLHTLNTWMPIFMHHAESGQTHPEQLFLALSSFAGQLTSFEVGQSPSDLPRFQFMNLAQTLFPLLDRIMSLMGTVVSARYQTIPLEQTQPGLFVARVTDPQLLRSSMLFLTAGGDLPDTTLRQDLPRYLKIGSLDQIANIVQAALPGVPAQIDLSPPSAIPIRAHMVYLRLEKGGKHWESVLHSGTIAIYQPIKPDRVALELLAVEG